MAVNPTGWSTTPGSNTTVDSISIAEGMQPAGVNNAMRSMMAGLKEYILANGGSITTGGSADAQTLTSGYSLSAYAAGQTFMFEAGYTNTGAATLNVDGVGAKAMVQNDGSQTALGAADIIAGAFYHAVYDANEDNFVITNISGVTLLDEDDMASDSATQGATQQSIKAYADAGDTGKHSIYIPAAAMVAASTNGAARGTTEETTNAHNYSTLNFDATTDEYACFEILMPKDWNEGTLTFQVVWTTTATDTDGVAWGLQAVAVADGDDSDVAYGTAVVVTDDAQSNAGDVLITAESSAVTVAGTPAAGELTQFRIFRDVSDANDDMTEDALLRGVRIYYTTDASDET